MKDLVKTLILPNAKAFVGFAVTILVSALALVGVSGDMTVSDALNVLVGGIATGLSVWVTSNRKK